MIFDIPVKHRGGLKNDTPSCIAAVLEKAPADIFEKCFLGAEQHLQELTRSVSALWALFLHLSKMSFSFRPYYERADFVSSFKCCLKPY